MTLDRQRGCLIGLAMGDALGSAVEFRAAGASKPVTGYRSGCSHDLAPGEWTDDTSMALALADNIACAGWDLNDQVKRYIAWWRQGEYPVNGTCFDIGITTRSALVRFPDCGDVRRYIALVLYGLMHGLNRDEVLSPDWERLSVLRAAEPLHPAIDEVATGSFRQRQPPQIKGSGYVVRSLEAALWAFHDAADFRDAVLRAVNLGDDADTTGAVCGQFARAYWGESGIPEDWRDKLARRAMIERAVAGLLGGSGGSTTREPKR